VHHQTIVPAGHDVDKAEAHTGQELASGVPREKWEKLQAGDRAQVPLRSDLQSGKDWQGSATATNRKMDSKQRTEGLRRVD
jgi:hypothetical protein